MSLFASLKFCQKKSVVSFKNKGIVCTKCYCQSLHTEREVGCPGGFIKFLLIFASVYRIGCIMFS
uniref:Uncharacterized protein n=1 Tax=Anguilla anguilla TaxID=7936 RepID=A0A0E9WST5_ANGAN